jgi:hypothetical protein
VADLNLETSVETFELDAYLYLNGIYSSPHIIENKGI